MKAKKALTPAMRRALNTPEMYSPSKFAPDQYYIHIPSTREEEYCREFQHGYTRLPPHAFLCRLVARGMFTPDPGQTRVVGRFAGRMQEDQVERLVDLHDRYEN
jgi:hypothetical protein